ncbi:MAG: DNA primase, partial [Oscillospiraceae bacterium]
YDGDAAGQKASQRAIGILEKLDLKVRVLRLTGAKDPDEFIKKNGAPAFENLLQRSENHIEYLLADVASKYDLASDESRVAFLKDATIMIAGLPGQVEREVYSYKVGEMARVSPDIVVSEVARVRKLNFTKAKKKQESEATRPAKAVQPREKALRFANEGSAMAEQGLISLLYFDPALFSNTQELSAEDFSVPLLGKLYTELFERSKTGEQPSMALLAGLFSKEEISLLSEILHKPQDLTNGEKALKDYIKKMKTEKLAMQQKSDGDSSTLLEFAKNQKQSKGYGG